MNRYELAIQVLKDRINDIEQLIEQGYNASENQYVVNHLYEVITELEKKSKKL